MQSPVTKSTSVNLTLTDNIYKPLTINAPFESLLIDLGLIYDATTVLTVEVHKLINMGTWAAIDMLVPTEVQKEEGFETAIRITLKKGSAFEEGEMYELKIAYTVKGSGEINIEKSYIAINYVLNDNVIIAALNEERKMVVCVSDIHMGQNDLYSEFRENRKPLIEFLNKLNASPNISELVIAGDLIDEWVIPARDDAHGEARKECSCFAEKVKQNNQEVFTALNKVCDNKKMITTYVPGNHDLLIDCVQIQKVLPNIKQARDTQGTDQGLGLGAYSPKDFPRAVIEHGHRLNFFCAPCLKVKNDYDEQSILPPGYFFTRVAAEAFCFHPSKKHELPKTELQFGNEIRYMRSQYSAGWLTSLKMLPVDYSPSEKFIKTYIDGFNSVYSLNDLMPHLKDGELVSTLYKTISDPKNWDDRQEANNVAVKIPVLEAIQEANSAQETDSMSNVQYFSNPESDKSIVVFGHSHEPRLLTYPTNKNETGIYANTGTWIDTNNLGMTTMTFVVLIAHKKSNSLPLFVNLYQYTPEGKIVLMDSQATVGYTPTFFNVKPIYRYLNEIDGCRDHFYTTNRDELGDGKDGYKYEGIAGYIYPEDAVKINLIPLYRYFNPKSGDHFYTTNLDELGKEGKGGYNYEGIAGKVFPAYDHTVPNLVPLHRYHNAKSGDHFYTTDLTELGINGKVGYTHEGIACYIQTSKN